MNDSFASTVPGAHLSGSLKIRSPPQTEGVIETAIELEHAIGFSGGTQGGLAIHPAGTEYVIASGGCIVLNNFSDPHQQCFLRGHTDYITSMHISSSGRMIASGQQGTNSDVIVWDYESKSIKYRLEEHQFGIDAVKFSRDERFLATVGCVNDRKMIIWDMTTGYIVGSSSVKPSPLGSIAWGGRVKDIKRRPTTDYLLATSGKQESKIYMWSLTPSTGELRHEPCDTGALKRVYTAITFSEDAGFLLAGSTSGDVSIFFVRNRGLAAVVSACGGGVRSLLSAPLGGFYVGGGDGSLTYIERENLKSYIRTRNLKLSGAVSCVSGSDGVELLAGTSDGEIHRIRTSTMQSMLLCQNHSGTVVDVAFPDGVSDRFATCSTDGSFKMWDASDYSMICQGRADPHSPTCISISDECIITGWNDGVIRSFDAINGEPLWLIDHAHSDSVTALALSPNEKFIVSGGLEGGVRVWEIRSKELICHLKEHSNRITDIAIYADNRHALSCSRDRSILCWDLQTEQRLSCHRQNMGGINGIALSKDASIALSVGQERRITYWDLRQPRAASHIDLEAEAYALAVSHDGRTVAVAGDNSFVKLYDFRSHKLLDSGVGHSHRVNRLAFSHDDKQIVSVGDDGNVFLWNVFSA